MHYFGRNALTIILYYYFLLHFAFRSVRKGPFPNVMLYITFDDLPSTHDLNSKYIIEHLAEKLLRASRYLRLGL